MERLQLLRYGENPQQRAALYVTEEPRGMRDLAQTQGKELSFNNLLDIDAAMWRRVVAGPRRPACSRHQHTTPCGIARRQHRARGLPQGPARPTRCRPSDRLVAFNTGRDRPTRQAMSDLFVEVVVAPSFHEDALARARRQEAVCASWSCRWAAAQGSSTSSGCAAGSWCRTAHLRPPTETAGRSSPSARRAMRSRCAPLRLGRVCLGQVERDPARARRARHRHRRRPDEPRRQRLPRHHEGAASRPRHGGRVARLRRLLPLPDGVEQAGQAGVTAIIQPGGSVRDAEVVGGGQPPRDAMIVTGARLFRH
jgi:phosphoribosylaminoimidazolecarboxamide formyltransferase/IMP cyclohydrolase